MRSLKTIIKLNRNLLNEIILEKNQIEQNFSELNEKQKKLKKEYEQELELYYNSQFAFAIDNYVSNTQKIINNYQKQKNSMTTLLSNINNKINDQFIELKKYQIIYDKFQKTNKEKNLKETERNNDEINSIKFNNNE